MTKVLIATGGTGGHIYPALMTAQELRRRGHEAIFIGRFAATREKILAAGFACEEVAAKGFAARGLLQKVEALMVMARALASCARIIRRVRPDIVIGFGGYSSFPTMAAALCCGVPAMIHEQNAVPGMANRVLATAVRRVAVGFKDALARFPKGKGVWTGNPLRPLDEGVAPEQARREFGLAPDKNTVLVFGGSQGSRTLNTDAAMVLAGMDVQVIHITGSADLGQVAQTYRTAGVACVVQAYMDRIGLAYAAADLVIARAGAGTVTELGVLGLPAILIPYPGANDHQKYNARVLERLGTAVIIEEKSLRREVLRDKIFSVLKRGSFRIQDHEKLKDEFVVDGAKRLCDELAERRP